MTTDPSRAASLVNVRGTQLLAGDTREQYRQKLARITLDSMVQFVGLLDAKGTVLEINQVALDAVGIKLSEVEGKPFWTTFWWQVSEEINQTLRESIRRASEGEFVRWDTEIYGRAGGKETIIIDASLMPVKDEYGNVAFITAEGRDITEKKAHEREIARQREELAQLDKLKTQFFANISHEFRTPLTLMMGPLEDTLARPEGLSALDRERLELARRNSVRLLKLVNALLDFSRIEAGRIQASYEPTDLSLLTTELASVFRSAIERAGMRLVIDCPPLPEKVYVDREMWEKVVLNLLSNAFKFTFEGEIEVALRMVDSHVQMTVRDTGTGIPTDEVPRLFERFHRVKGAHGRSFEGSGIGLALVQELIKLHGGVVRVESEVDRGTRFVVTLPLGKAHLPVERIQAARTASSTAFAAEAYVDEAERWLPTEPAFPAEEPLPQPLTMPAPEAVVTQKDLIVVADDNADMREYVSHLLHEEYRVHAVRDGRQAVEATLELRPALVLTDVMMPEVDGFGVLRAIRSDPSVSSTPVILLSARAGEESRVEGLQAGADDYLVKPFTARELLARVTTHVKMANLRREAAEREERLRTEAELERHRLHELLAQAPAAIGLLSGPEHRWTYVNDHYLRVTGRSSASDFVGKTLPESLPEVQPVFSELLDQSYRTGQPYFGREMKATLKRSAGREPEEAYFDFVYQPIRDAGGQVEGILVHAVEVTDRVIARRLLEENEERFRAIVDTTPECVKVVAPDGTLLHMNSAGLKMIGAECGEAVIGKNVYDLIAAEDREKFRAFNERICRGEKGSLEFDIIGIHGQRRHMEAHAAPLRTGEGTTVQLAVTRDIGVRKQADEVRHRLAAIVQSSEDAIISKDLRGIVTSWNPAAERMFGYTPEEMIGQPITMIIPPALHDDEQLILETIGRGQRIEHFETVRLSKRGEPIEVSLTISPVKDEAGRIIGAAKIARDITELKKTEQALRTTEKLASVGRLAATVAHEINNPLEAVTNLIYLARNATVRNDVREYLSAAEEELERISHLTKQTLGFYRDSKGAALVKLGVLVTSLLSVFNSKIRNKEIEVETEVRQDPEIMAVSGELRQLLANLLSNSIDAVQPGGRIRIRVSAATELRGQRRPGVRLTVADSGSGIPPAVHANLFEPFFTTKKDVGTGLGLWVCKNIVEKHRGHIQVKSCVAPGRSWTAFSVFLPVNSLGVVHELELKQAV